MFKSKTSGAKETNIQQTNKSPGIILISYQPERSFFNLPFEERLKKLESAVHSAEEHAKTLKLSPDTKIMFVAPEYLFKDLSRKGPARYYSHKQKKEFVATIKRLSLESDMILIPGTICWKKPAKADDQTYYRNTAYFFHQGKVDKYKKRFPHMIFDIDYFKSKTVSLDQLDAYETKFKTGEKKGVLTVGGITIGIEICFDHIRKSLADSLDTEGNDVKKIDIHLIISNGLSNSNLYVLRKEGLRMAKIDRGLDDSVEEKYRSFAGSVVQFQNSILFTNNNLTPSSLPSYTDLHVYDMETVPASSSL